jgi:DNA-binding MarR family transcriptional regulator
VQLNAEDHAATQRLCAALRHGMAATAQTVPVQWLRALTLLSIEDGLTMTEIARTLGASQSTMSRQLLDMGQSKRDGAAGHGLVYSVPHPSVPCAKAYRLTSKGQTLVREMAERLGACPAP